MPGDIKSRCCSTKAHGTVGTVGDITRSVSGLAARGQKSVATARSTAKMGQARRRLGLGHCHIRRRGATRELTCMTPRRRWRHLAASLTAPRQLSLATKTGSQIEVAVAVAATVFGRGSRRATDHSNHRVVADATKCRTVTHRRNTPMMPSSPRRPPCHLPPQLRTLHRPCSIFLPMELSITASTDHRRPGVTPLLGIAALGTNGMDINRWPLHLGRER